jgi:hypothetical protein
MTEKPALCASPRCHDTGKHQPDCADERCRGCLPKQAGASLRLCYDCADRIGTDATAAAVLHAELEGHLAVGGTGGGFGGNPHPSLVINDAVVEVRGLINGRLNSWVRLIHDEAGYALPEPGWRILPLPPGVHGPARRLKLVDTGLDHLAAWLALHARWLAAHDAAGDCADEMADSVGQARRMRQHSGTRVAELGPCPRPGCDGQLRGIVRQADNHTPTEVRCNGDTDGQHIWLGEAMIVDLGREIGVRDEWPTAKDVARREHVALGTVHRWASENRWRKTEDGRRPVLYHPDDVHAWTSRLAKVAA